MISHFVKQWASYSFLVVTMKWLLPWQSVASDLTVFYRGPSGVCNHKTMYLLALEIGWLPKPCMCSYTLWWNMSVVYTVSVWIHCNYYTVFIGPAETMHFGWLVDKQIMRGVWRSAWMESGVQYAMTYGAKQMQMLSVDSLDTHQEVSMGSWRVYNGYQSSLDSWC